MATQVTVTGTLTDAEGTALTGTVTFRPSQPMADSAGARVIATAPVVATLNGSGAFSVVVYATDDATTQPDGATYDVSEDLTGADGTAIDRKYRVEIPAADTTLRYEDLVEVQSRPSYSYATTSTVATLDAIVDAGLDSSGNVIRRSFPTGGRFAGLGHSLVMAYQSGLPAPASKPSPLGWMMWASYLSDGRLSQVLNAGVGGENSTEILARVSTVFPYAPDICFVQCLTNDTADNLPAATSEANLRAIIEALRAGGVYPVICSEFPKETDQAEVSTLNAMAREVCLDLGVDLLDFNGPTNNGTTGEMVAGYTSDGTHTSESGARRSAEQAVIPWLDQVGARPSPLAYVCTYDLDPANIIEYACFNSAAMSNSAAPGWVYTLAETSGSHTWSLETPDADDGVIGNYLRIEFANFDGTTKQQQQITADPAVGDWLAFAIPWEAIDVTGDATLRCSLHISGSTTILSPVSTVQASNAGGSCRGISTLLYQVPASSTTSQFQIELVGDGTNSGAYRVWQPTIQNLGSTLPGAPT